jgi:hypothetical protein
LGVQVFIAPETPQGLCWHREKSGQVRGLEEGVYRKRTAPVSLMKGGNDVRFKKVGVSYFVFDAHFSPVSAS